MAHITRNELEAQHIRLDITLSPVDYLGRFEKEIKSLSRNAQVKGFRPGKTPPSMIKRMYGSGVLLETVQDLLVDKLNDYLDDTKPKLLGNPILSAKQPENRLSLTHPTDITFSYEIGLRPEINLGDIESTRYNRYSVEVPDSLIDETVEKIRASYKQNIDLAEGNIEAGDSFKVSFQEVDGTLTGETTLSMKFIKEDEQPHFIGKQPGDKITIDIFDLEKNSDDKSVRKYILGLDDTDERPVNKMFELTVLSLIRSMPGTVGEEMYKSVFPDKNITDELTFRETLRTVLADNDSLPVNRLLTYDIVEHLKDRVTLPDSFMKTWILSQDEKRSRADTSQIDEQYPVLAETMKREVLISEIIQHFKLHISEEELMSFLDRYYGVQYGMPSLGPELTKMIYDKMKKEDSAELRGYTQTLMEAKIGNYFYEKGLTNSISISAEELDKKWKKFVGREEAMEFLSNEGHDHEGHDHETHDPSQDSNPYHLFEDVHETPIEVIE